MFDGNQVLRFENKFKSSDIGGLGIELKERKGTGNYDLERTKFNHKFVNIETPTLLSQVYSTLNKNGIYYNKGKNTNLLNGAVVTSGPEFFEKLGMKFKESDRTYSVGKKKGKKIMIPDIKSDEDIPEKIKNFFKDSYEFLEEYVGKENIIYAEVHYDEDTPHMHFYFLPIVNQVKRKVFETDKDGNIIKHKIVGKDGIERDRPIQKKDENGNNIYRIEEGKFLNCDQFWKEKGGIQSFAKVQDKYNNYIQEKGYNLFRGNIGSNVYHQDKNERKMEELTEQINDAKNKLDEYKKLNTIQLEQNAKLKNIDKEEILNPQKRKLVGYKDEDINELINYSKSIQKENVKNGSTIKEKNLIIDKMSKAIDKLNTENTKLLNGTAIIERDNKIEEQKQTINGLKKLIKQKDEIIDHLENTINKIQEKFNDFKEKIYKFCDKLCRAIAHKENLNEHEYKNMDYDDFEYLANRINKKYERDKSDDFEL